MRAILVRRWSVIGALMLASAGLASLMTTLQPDHYVSTGTFVVQPQAAEQSDVVRAVSTLSDAAAINATFVEIGESTLVEERARARLGIGDRPIPGLSIDWSVFRGTNVVKLSVRTRDSALSRNLARAIGRETVGYVAEVSDVFALSDLDPATLPQEAQGVNLVVRLAAAMVVGFIVAATAVVIFEQIRTSNRIPVADRRRRSEMMTSFLDQRYTELRLSEEMSRSDHGRTAFGLAALDVTYPWRNRARGPELVAVPDRRDLRRIARTVRATLRPHDHLGHIAGPAPGTFAVIVPDATESGLADLTASWQRSVEALLTRRFGPGVIVACATCRYEDESFEGDDAAVQLTRSLLVSTTA